MNNTIDTPLHDEILIFKKFQLQLQKVIGYCRCFDNV